MQRITRKHLDAAIVALNREAGTPASYIDLDGRGISIGHYCLEGAYGGWQLQQVCNEAGGARVISGGGYVPARDLYNQIWTAIEVIRRNAQANKEKM